MALRYVLCSVLEAILTAQIVGYLSAALVCNTLGVNSLIYSGQGGRQAAAAGFILLSMVVVGTTRVSNTHMLTLSGCLDLLFRVQSTGIPSRIRRLLCSAQGEP